MIVECSNCHTKYNVDEKRIPPDGVKVKCHKCQHVISIKREESVPQPIEPEVPAPPTEEPEVPSEPTQEPGVPTEPSGTPETEESAETAEPPSEEIPETPTSPAEPEVPFSQPEPPSEEIPQPPEPEISEPEVPVEQPPPPEVPQPPEVEIQPPPKEVAPEPGLPPEAEMSEEDKKWYERARRLAKALASDLVLYNKDKVEEGLREGTLANLLGSEIRRSWEYYCQQIPKHIVESTDFFKEQLNKIVGKGKEIFK